MSESQWHAQWRASAHEAVPYTDDMPECLSVLPELFDGAIGQGKATQVITCIELYNDKPCKLWVKDNGKGITDVARLLTWASKSSTHIHHRYGHGSKKCLTKFNKNYNAVWHVKYRTCDKRKHSSSLWTYTHPFVGNEKSPEEDEKDEKILMPSGTEWYIEFDINILGRFTTAQSLFNILKELIRTRYSSKYFNETDFILDIKGDKNIKESSKTSKWKSFEECLKDEVINKTANCIYDKIHPFNENVTMRCTKYHIHVPGNTHFNLKREFPTYGHKNQKSARLHIALMGRTIESPPIWKYIEGRTATHNDDNGLFYVIDFESVNGSYDNMPTPCTTKVSFYENCTHHAKFRTMMYNIHKEIKKDVDVIINPLSGPQTPLNSNEPLAQTPLYSKVWNKYIGNDIIKHKCLCCKLRNIQKDNFEFGYVISLHNNGSQDVKNIRPICSLCNTNIKKQNMVDYVTKCNYYFG